MKRQLTVLGLTTFGTLALHAAPALADEQVTQEVQVYGGEIFGDRLTETPISGATPRLNDAATVGARYNYGFTENWGVQLSAGYSPAHAGHIPGGDINLGLTTVDIDGVFSLPIGYNIVPYAELGAGYAWAKMDDFSGLAGTTPQNFTDSNGYTANVGLGVKYYITNNLFVDLDARYRYYSKLVSPYGQGLNTSETTVGVGWRF